MATYGPSFNTNPDIQQYANQRSALKFATVGDWAKAQRVLNFLASPGNTGAKKEIARGQVLFAKKLKTALVKGIKTEGASIGETWPKHSKKYEAWARKKGFGNTGLLRLSNNYIRALQNMRVLQKGYTTSLKLSSSDLYKRSHKKGLIMSQYAVLLEVGSLGAKIEKRELWGPSFKSVGGNKALIQMVQQAVAKKMISI